MAIGNWHVGKVVLLWIWGIVITGLTIQILKGVDTFLLGFIVIGVIIGIPVALSVTTWKWLGGKEE